MSEEQQSTATSEPAERPPADAAPFRIATVLKIVIPVGLVLVGAVTFFGVFDGAAWLAGALRPPLVPVTGQVFWNGEPLADAEVETQPVDPELPGARGTGNENGEFQLRTHIQGDFLNGAYAGEHRVIVKVHANVMTLGEPPVITPEEYASFDTSPLRIEVVESENRLELRLQGEAQEIESRWSGTMRPPDAVAEAADDAQESSDDAQTPSDDAQAPSDDAQALSDDAQAPAPPEASPPNRKSDDDAPAEAAP